jgi:lysophospholipase L1-like esterase
MRPGQGVGALQRPAALRHFFESLEELEAKAAHDDVRIVQFGDSHTAADIATAVVRRALQSRFGDGGRGFVAIGKPWKGYMQDGIRCGMSGDWATTPSKRDRGEGYADGLYGLAGIGLVSSASSRGARAWTDIATGTGRAELDYLEQPNGGSFDVVVDGVRIVRIATRADHTGSAFRTLHIDEAYMHQIEVRSVGDGDVRVYGVALDRSENGVVFDALGINGARITTCLQWNEPHWAEQLRHRSPSLVVLSYGTNESTDDSTSIDTYERQLKTTLERVARAVPSASCLLLGPPDRAVANATGNWVTASKLLAIIASQKRVAAASGCAFYDQLDAMGGPGTMAEWSMEEPPRAQSDRVHLTREGYAQLGSSFASDLMRAYAAWRRDSAAGTSSTVH